MPPETPINVTVVGTPSSAGTTTTSTAPTTPVAGTSSTSGANAAGSNNVSTGNGASTSTTSTTPGSIKGPIPTDIVPNPLHKYASYTYAWSLWLLDTDDFNSLMDVSDAGLSRTMPLPKSYVVAEDSGLYTSKRLPTQFGLNYNIQHVQFETTVGANGASKHTNMIDGSVVVVEPYGVTLIDSLALASKRGNVYQNYTQQPFMLQLDFFGYDDNGNEISTSETTLLRKRFPIRINSMNLQVTKTGAEYTFHFTPAGHSGTMLKVPKQINISGGKVGEVLGNLSSKLNEHWASETRRGISHFANSVKFDIDDLIAGSKVVYDKQMSLTDAKPTGNTVSMTSTTFSIPSGSSIVEVIDKIVLQSDYVIDQLGLNLQDKGLTPATATAAQQRQSLTQVFNAFRTTCQARFIGTTGSGATVSSAFDNSRNTYPIEITYKIKQYPVFNGTHPALPTLSDSRPFIVKDYNYTYTGKNIDILDFKLAFDYTWFTEVNVYNNQYAAAQATASTGVDTLLSNAPSIMLSPQLLASSGAVPALGAIPVINPVRLQPVVHDQRDAQLQVIKDPNKVTAANAMRSLYSNSGSDMISVDLDIVGDPTLLKQDDWLYSPSPNSINNYNRAISQKEFSNEYGHVKMDAGALIVKLTVNTPIDNDTDWANQGLVFPQPGTYTSMFSGLFSIIKIRNTFENGQFKQKLVLARQPNTDYISNAAPDAVSNSDRNQSSTNSTVTPGAGVNNSTPASEGGAASNSQSNQGGR